MFVGWEVCSLGCIDDPLWRNSLLPPSNHLLIDTVDNPGIIPWVLISLTCCPPNLLTLARVRLARSLKLLKSICCCLEGLVRDERWMWGVGGLLKPSLDEYEVIHCMVLFTVLFIMKYP